MLVKSDAAGTWSDVPKAVYDAVWSAPRGAYQTALVRGAEAWSGAGLRGGFPVGTRNHAPGY